MALDFLLLECLCFFQKSLSLKCYKLKIRVEGQKEGSVERPAASDGSLGSFSPLSAVLFGAHMPGHALTCTVLFVFLTPWVPCSSKCLSTSESECEESVYAFLLTLEALTPVGPVDLFHVFLWSTQFVFELIFHFASTPVKQHSYLEQNRLFRKK